VPTVPVRPTGERTHLIARPCAGVAALEPPPTLPITNVKQAHCGRLETRSRRSRKQLAQRRLPRQQQVDLVPFVVDRLLDPPFEVVLPPGRVGIARDAVLVAVVDRQLLELPTRAGRGRLA
jgi:hypothetical protein